MGKKKLINPIKEVCWEVCPHCEEEVELVAELMVQTCPHCGKRIVTCSMCRACDANDGKNYCSNCCLDHLARVENEEMEQEKEVLAIMKSMK